MRGPSLGGDLARRLVVSPVTLLVAGCIAAGSAVTADPTAPAALTIATAPGENAAFDPEEPTVRARGPITITLRNASSLPHNLVFTAGLSAATRTIVEPGSSDEVVLPPLGPGEYPFVCTIHDGMSGTLVVRR